MMLLVAALCAGEAQAQWRKTWDFTQGYSETTKTNLNLDTDNWAANRYDDDGVTVTGWKDVSNTVYGELTANGEAIEELRGLTFGTAGLSSNGQNFLLDPTSIRMARESMEVTFPKLIGGQTITAVAKSANSSATVRGIVSATDELEYISGPEGGICLGSSVDGAPSDGLYTLVWKVRDDVMDSVSVTLKIVGGGIDIKSFRIDASDDEETSKVAYIYDSTYPDYSIDNDEMFAVISEVVPYRADLTIESLDIADESVRQDVTADSLQGYNVVVLSPYVNTDNEYLQTLKEAIAFTPMLNLSPEVYAVWGYGTAVQTNTNLLTINGNSGNISFFKPTDSTSEPYIDDNGQLEMLVEGSNIVGYNAPEGTYFAADSILAYADGTTAVHAHNITRNAYILLPYTAGAELMESAADIIPSAIIMLANTKRTVGATGTPVVSQEYHHLYTTVSISTTTANSEIHYTINGDEPTMESTLYTGPFDIDQEGVTVKAIALGDGFLISAVGEQTIDIYQLSGAPTISYTQESGVSTVTITPASEGDAVFYNLIESTDTTRSSRYTEPFTLTKHATVTAFASANEEEGTLASDPVSLFIPVADEQVRLDVIAHMDANSTDWSVDGNYYLDRNGYAYYSENIIGTNEDGSSIYEPANVLTCYAPGNGWVFKSYGQPALWQNNGVTHNVANFDGYNPQSALDDDSEITSYDIQLAAVTQCDLDGNTDPASASLSTTDYYDGPFDVVGYVAGHNAVVYVDVNTDTTNTEGWQRIGQLNGGSIEGYDSSGRDRSDRIWRKTIVPYDGTEAVVVRLMTDGGAAIIFDVFLKNEGEESKAYITGISDITTSSTEAAGEVVSRAIYSINGTRLAAPTKGINIVKEVYANGKVTTKKVVVKD